MRDGYLMKPSRGYQAYENSAVLTASPEQLVVMLYDGCLRFLRRAEKACGEGNRVAQSTATSRATAIIAELNATLDVERGGEIAESLRGLYGFLNRHIVECSINNDAQGYGDAIVIIEGLRDAFSEALRQVSDAPAASA